MDSRVIHTWPLELLFNGELTTDVSVYYQKLLGERSSRPRSDCTYQYEEWAYHL
jgi:hypothetical protein